MNAGEPSYTLGWRVSPDGEYPFPPEWMLDQAERELAARTARRRLDGIDAASGLEGVQAALRAVCRDERLSVSKESALKAAHAAWRTLDGFGPLDPLLADPSLEEIAVTGIHQPVRVYVRGQGWVRTGLVFDDAESAINLVNKMARPLGRRVSYQTPRVDAALPDGTRLHATIAPIAASGVEVTLRRFVSHAYSPAHLIASGVMDARLAALLWLALEADTSLLVAGNTGSGKTTTLNALFGFVPQGERVVVTEQTPELKIPHAHQVRLVAQPDLGIHLADLAKDTLRMRPDRVVIGEVRDAPEARALMDCLLAGQARGAYATLHGESAREAARRLESFGAAKEDVSAAGLILVQRRLSTRTPEGWRERRRVTQVCELDEEGRTHPLVEWNAKDDTWTLALEKSALWDRLRVAHASDTAQLKAEWSRRHKFLERLAADEKARELSAFIAEVDAFEKP